MLERRLRYRDCVRDLVRDEHGTTAIEYALIASVISIAIVGAATAIGTALHENFYSKAMQAFE